MSIVKFGALTTLCMLLFVVSTNYRAAHAQSRTWHYNSNNFTQPASLPRYAGVPVRPKFGHHKLTGWTTPVAAPACNTCAPAVPQPVTYAAPVVAPVVTSSPCGTGCQPAPIASYQPVSACNPCPQPVAVMRPKTSCCSGLFSGWCSWFRCFKRPTYAPAPVAVTSYASPCAPATCGVPYAAPACSPCAPAASPYYSQPATPAPIIEQPAIESPSTPPPTLEPTPQEAAPPEGGTTFKKPEFPPLNGPYGNDGDASVNGSSRTAPPDYDPADRSTRRPSHSPIRQALYSPTANVDADVPSQTQAEIDAAGWRSAK